MRKVAKPHLDCIVIAWCIILGSGLTAVAWHFTRKLAKSRVVWMIAAVFVVFGLGLVAVGWHFRIYSWWDYEVFGYMNKECHPAWREFNFRRIGPGADLAAVVNSTKPARIDTYGDFVVLGYEKGIRLKGPGVRFTGLSVTAYKGRLVEAVAWSCCWTKTFFDVLTAEEKELWTKEYEAYMKPINERWDREMAEERLKEAQNAPRNEIAP